MELIPITLKFEDVGHQRKFTKSLSRLPSTGDGFEINLPPTRDAQHASEFCELLVTFFENDGAEAIKAVAELIVATLAVANRSDEDEKEVEESKQSVQITINELNLEIDDFQNEVDIKDSIEQMLLKNSLNND